MKNLATVKPAGDPEAARRPRDPARAALRAAAAAALLLASSTAPAQAAEDRRVEAERLRIENLILERKIELAAGESFYLVLDPRDRSLALMLKGALLHRYELVTQEVGSARVLFVSRGARAGWQGRIWSGGRLDPPRERDRIEIQIPPPGADEPPEPVVPPPAEQAYEVPTRYRIRFEGGLGLEVVAADIPPGAGLWDRLAGWWRDLGSALIPSNRDIVRLRVSLRAEDARNLYRSLPPDSRFLALPPN